MPPWLKSTAVGGRGPNAPFLLIFTQSSSPSNFGLLAICSCLFILARQGQVAESLSHVSCEGTGGHTQATHGSRVSILGAWEWYRYFVRRTLEKSLCCLVTKMADEQDVGGGGGSNKDCVSNSMAYSTPASFVALLYRPAPPHPRRLPHELQA